MAKCLFKERDKVKVPISPHKLTDPHNVGIFIFHRSTKVFTIEMVIQKGNYTIYKLNEDASGWWFDEAWLQRASEIVIGGE